MSVTTYTNASFFDAMKPLWNKLLAHSTSNTPFQTWEYQSAWWQAYGNAHLWSFTVANDNGEVIAIAPLFIEHVDGQRIVRFVGHIDVTDYLDFIIDNDQRADAYAQIAAHFAANRDQFDALGLANLRQDSLTYHEFPQALRDAGFEVSFEENEVAPVIPLPPDYDSYLSGCVESKQRKEIKRKMRKAEVGEYDVQWYIVDADHDLDEEMARFLALMASATPEKAEFLEDTRHTTFFKQMLPQAFANGWLQLMFITIDGHPSAAYLNFDYGSRIYVYNSGLTDDRYGALSPGIVLVQYAIQHAIETGHDTFDFLRGDEQYKYHMGGQNTHLHQINAT